MRGMRVIGGGFRWLVLFLPPVVHGAAQQTAPAPAPRAKEPTKSRHLTDEQLRARLDEKRGDMLRRVLPERVAKKGKLAEEKWFAEFQAIQSEHYLLFTNGPTTTVRRFADSLEELYAFVRKQFPFEDVAHLLECYIFKDEEEYFRFCVQITGWTEAEARGTAGHSTGDYYATYYQSPKAPVVMHEATHQIVFACLHVFGVGSWFQEGMAVYVEKKIQGLNPSAEARSRVKGDDCYHLGDLMELPVLLSDPKGNGHRNYEQAGAVIDFMVNTKLAPLAGKFPAFLEKARAAEDRGRKDSEALIRKVYGIGVDELEALWRQHLGLKP